VQNIQGHTGLTHYCKFFDIWALWRSELSARVPKCQKTIKMVFRTVYGPEHFEV